MMPVTYPFAPLLTWISLMLWPLLVSANHASVSPDMLNDDPFVIVVKTNAAGVSGDTEFTIPVNSAFRYNYEVDWSYDGVTFNADDTGVSGAITHDYGTAGLFTIAIRGMFPQIYFNDRANTSLILSDARKLTDIIQWGDIQWASMENSFSGCTNLSGSALDLPDLSQVTSTRRMFEDCSNFNMVVSGWDMGNVQDFSNMFRRASSFDRGISFWDLSNATDLSGFLSFSGYSTTTYESWLVSLVGKPFSTGLTVGVDGLSYCSAEVSRKITIDSLGWIFDGDQKDCPFIIVVKTNNPGDATSSTEYRIPISNNQSYTYNYQVDWSYDGVNFNVESDNVTTGITHDYGVEGTFTIAIRGDFPAFYNNTPLAGADPSNLLEIKQWGSIAWESFNVAFAGSSHLEITATDLPDLSNVSSMAVAFNRCGSMVGHPSMAYWEVSNITTFRSAFEDCDLFNQDLSRWDVSAADNLSDMFKNASSFSQNLGSWDLSNLTNNLGRFIANSGMDVDHYDATLIGWAAQTVPWGIQLSAIGLEYCLGEPARNVLIDTYGWSISFDTYDCGSFGSSCPADLTVSQLEADLSDAFRAANTLETTGSVVLPTDRFITFYAGESITLNPGFVAQGPFRATIQSCILAMETQPITDHQKETNVIIPEPFGKKESGLELGVFPNPAHMEATLTFRLNANEPVTLTLHSLKGQVLETLLQNQMVDAGATQVHLTTHHLPAGLYLLRLQTPDAVETSKLSVTKNGIH